MPYKLDEIEVDGEVKPTLSNIGEDQAESLPVFPNERKRSEFLCRRLNQANRRMEQMESQLTLIEQAREIVNQSIWATNHLVFDQAFVLNQTVFLEYHRREGKEREIHVVHQGKETNHIHEDLETAVVYYLAQTYAPQSVDDAAWAAGIILNMWGHNEEQS